MASIKNAVVGDHWVSTISINTTEGVVYETAVFPGGGEAPHVVRNASEYGATATHDDIVAAIEASTFTPNGKSFWSE